MKFLNTEEKTTDEMDLLDLLKKIKNTRNDSYMGETDIFLF